MGEPFKISLEQEFNLRKFAGEVKKLSRSEAQERLVELHRQMMLQDNLYRTLVARQWGIDAPPASG
ncbi:NblA/ycf18 family protein [Baaleninema simplex]|uniref:NblA/ycf18 family protein n=1 Tax=Baaleninema simplex TaxID=2862350 RepID=UPI00034D0669|nr:NblA/ycf18 family protein [Baaleninema simplex]